MLITICGSRKNDKLMNSIKNLLDRKTDHDILLPKTSKVLLNPNSESLTNVYKGVNYSNRERIKKSDLVIIISDNMGIDTTLELGYAYAFDKPIISIGIDDVHSRNALYSHTINKDQYNINIVEDIISFIKTMDIKK